MQAANHMMEMNNNACEKVDLLSIHEESTWQEVAADTQKNKKKKKKKAEKMKKRDRELRSNSNQYVQSDIIPNILGRLPAEQLVGKFRFTCRAWCDIISTQLDPNLPDSELKFILQTPRFRRTHSRVMVMTNGELVPHREQFTCDIGELKDSCKGLLLSKDFEQRGVLHVSNRVLGKEITLPACPSGCSHRSCSCSLAFDPYSNVFKVVHMCADQFGYEIFSLGIDKVWRRIPGPFGETYMRPFDGERFYWANPISVGGKILHWNVDSNEYLISMDVSDEKTKKTYLPSTADTKFCLMEMGGFLSAMFYVSNSQIDVWVLEDFDKERWMKRHSIVASSIISDARPNPCLGKLEPVLTLRNGEVILFKKDGSRSSSSLYTYDINVCRMRKLMTPFKGELSLLVHRSSFNSWDPRDKLPTASQLYESLL